ncbi:4'-phosphopantetheinyl transferase family protein [Brucellaceae bacterium D45D]
MSMVVQRLEAKRRPEIHIRNYPSSGASSVLDEGCIDIWVVNIGQDGESASEHSLSPDEYEKACRFKTVQLRQRYIRAHDALRRVLSRYAGRPADSLPFTYSAFGKPSLDIAHAPHFNLSHSCDKAVIAVSQQEVGIDIDEIKPDPPYEIASSFLSGEEKALLMAAVVSERKALFYRLWTAKEAVSKGIGLGLLLDFRKIAIWTHDENLLVELSSDVSQGRRWCVQHLPVLSNFIVGVASPCDDTS